jgi:hypothetical protein
MKNLIVKRTRVKLTESFSIKSYRFPSGENRISLSDASEALGYSQGWLKQVLYPKNCESSTIKSLYKLGFSGETIRGQIAQGMTGLKNKFPSASYRVKTISFQDFFILVDYAVAQSKPKAVKLNQELIQSHRKQ